MLTPLDGALLLAGFYVGWNIGANDSANCIGTMVGAGFVSFRKAALLMGGFVLLGGVMQSHRVMHTVGNGILVSTEAAYETRNGQPAPVTLKTTFPEERLPPSAILAALLSSGIFVTLATFARIPVSTSQAMVGSVAGVGLAMVGMNPSFFQTTVLLRIAASWVLSPLLALCLALTLYAVLRRLLRHGNALRWSATTRSLLFLTAAYVAFTLGANDVGHAMGPLMNRFPAHGVLLAGFGGFAIAVGALTFGKRVCETVGRELTDLDYARAFCAQLSAASAVHFFTRFGVPVSSSQAIVGAVIGVGLLGGRKALRTRRLPGIALGWLATPLAGCALAASLYLLLHPLLT